MSAAVERRSKDSKDRKAKKATICQKHNLPLIAFCELDKEFACDECIITNHAPPVHQLVCLREAVHQLMENYNQVETELHVRLELAKTLFAKRLIQSRESRVEMMNLIKLVIEEIENGLPEDDSRFERLLISIKETDRVLNNAVLCTRVIEKEEALMYKDKDSVEGGIRRLKEQTDFINSSIKEFEGLKVARIIDIRK